MEGSVVLGPLLMAASGSAPAWATPQGERCQAVALRLRSWNVVGPADPEPGRDLRPRTALDLPAIVHGVAAAPVASAGERLAVVHREQLRVLSHGEGIVHRVRVTGGSQLLATADRVVVLPAAGEPIRIDALELEDGARWQLAVPGTTLVGAGRAGDVVWVVGTWRPDPGGVAALTADGTLPFGEAGTVACAQAIQQLGEAEGLAVVLRFAPGRREPRLWGLPDPVSTVAIGAGGLAVTSGADRVTLLLKDGRVATTKMGAPILHVAQTGEAVVVITEEIHRAPPALTPLGVQSRVSVLAPQNHAGSLHLTPRVRAGWSLAVEGGAASGHAASLLLYDLLASSRVDREDGERTWVRMDLRTGEPHVERWVLDPAPRFSVLPTPDGGVVVAGVARGPSGAVTVLQDARWLDAAGGPAAADPVRASLAAFPGAPVGANLLTAGPTLDLPSLGLPTWLGACAVGSGAAVASERGVLWLDARLRPLQTTPFP